MAYTLFIIAAASISLLPFMILFSFKTVMAAVSFQLVPCCSFVPAGIPAVLCKFYLLGFVIFSMQYFGVTASAHNQCIVSFKINGSTTTK